MKLTAAAVERLALEVGVTDRIVFDDDVPGFGIRIRESGRRSWIYQYKIAGKTRRLALGEVSAIKLAKARDIASDLHAKVRLGGDPASEKRDSVQRASNTFSALAESFIAAYTARPKTVGEVQRHLRKYAAPLHHRSLDSITLRDVADLLSKIEQASGAVSANRVRASLSQLFVWGMQNGIATSNPVADTIKRKEQERERVLSDDELRAVWIAAGVDDYGDVIRLLILTGQRRGEISDLQWREVDLERGLLTLPGERTKNHRPHTVPLAATSKAILAGRQRGTGAVFACGSLYFAKEKLNARCGFDDWTVHDLRRTAATGMAEIGIAPHVIEAVLNHVSGHKGGVAGIYNRASYAAEKAVALARWDEHVTGLVG